MIGLRKVLLGGVLILAAVAATSACDAVVVGRLASADGSVLLGHNEENALDRVIEFRKIPRLRHEASGQVNLRRGGRLEAVPETGAFLWSENPGLEYSDGYLNEWGVAVVSIQCTSREDGYDALVVRGEIRDGGIGYMLRRLVAARARSAREGMELIGRLVERFGYADSGRTYALADPQEAWLAEAVDRSYAVRIGTVQESWLAMEAQLRQEQTRIEAEACSLWPTDPDAARALLTRFCADRLEACAAADKLTETFISGSPR